jgi:hypothetical protein
MRKIEVIFLVSVLGVGVVFAWMSMSQALQLRPTAAPAHAVPLQTSGEPRDVDMDRLQQMLRQGHLSDREAEFYKPVSPGD